MLNLFGQEKGSKIKDECQVQNLAFENISNDNALMPYIIDEDRRGIIELHPFSLDEIGGWDGLVNSLTDDVAISFSHVGTKVSRLRHGTYHRFQQYYKGIPVEDGGLTILVDSEDPQAYIGPPCPGCPMGPSNPCDLVHAIAPHIYDDININTTPTISHTSIISYLDGQVIESDRIELKIANNINRNCEYKLVYQVDYTDAQEGDLVGWIDASTGETLYKTSRHNNKNAPTTDSGTQFMNDQVEGNNTVLQNDRLTAHDMSGETANSTNQLGDDFDNDQIPESPTTRDWNCIDQTTVCNDAPTNVFQAFWMTDQVIEEFETQLGIVFEDVHIGIHPTAFGATSFGPAHPDDRSNYVFGFIGGNSTVEYDVIAHELGHTIIREFISSAQVEGGSLHEGLADMFGTYIESILDPNGIDWVMGDDIPFTVRDLQNTNLNCFTNIQNLTQVHDRSEALGHWFFLCVNGDATNNIPPMNIDEVIGLVYEALPNLGDNPDYPDLMDAVMDLAEGVYGTCSDQFLTILRSWEQICVPTGHRMANPNAPCAVLTGNTNVCEESNYINICLSSNSGLNTTFGRWNIIGRNSTTFKSVRGMQGNAQQGGACIQIYEIPEMPFYPQTITIKYWNSNIGQNITRRVTIRDCDGDDPTCEEYYDNQGLVGNDDHDNSMQSVLPIRSSFIDSDSESIQLQLIVFDLMGNRLNITEQDLEMNRQFDSPRIVIFTYWNQHGELVESKKVLIH